MKSHESELLEVAYCVYKDAVAKCTDVTLDVRDLLTLKSRFEDEGLSFLTITLPTFGKDFDLSLAQGGIDPTLFRSFKKRAKAPAFLQGFFSHIFDEAGRIHDEPSVAAIEGVRQLAYVFKKLQTPCTPKRVGKALTKFTEAEHVFEKPLLQEDVTYFRSVSRTLWGSVFGGANALARAIPKHGPGATAEKLSGNAKFLLQRWHDRLEPYFPLLDYAFANADARFSKEFEKVTIVPVSEEQPVRVVPVPKTLKTPRIIAIEPVCMQYAQQALSGRITNLIEAHPLTSGHVNFTDQSVNRGLALSSSNDGRFATLDLSSASDLVPYELALSMFDSDPDLMGAVAACRSTSAQMPDGDVIPLRKFASMGSALCFPVEAMYFYTICIAALLRKRNLPVSLPSIKEVKESVFVYGDDIIVPSGESEEVTCALHKYYCKVNVRKSFSVGKFRESCGMDAFGGDEVTPTYLRQLPPSNLQNANALISWVATSNLFYKRGYWRTASALINRVEKITGLLPVVGPQCAGLGLESFQNAVSIKRWNSRYQVPEVRTWQPMPVFQADVLDGYPALLKSLLRLRTLDVNSPGEGDTRHLERTARHGAVTLKRRWMRPY